MLIMAACSGSVIPPDGSGSGSAGGSGTGPDDPTSQPPIEAEELPGARVLRKLTQVQYANAVEDLLGVRPDPSGLEADSLAGGLSSIGAGQDIYSAAAVRKRFDAAEQVLDSAASDSQAWAKIHPCLQESAVLDCIDAFIEDVGARAFRRPLTSEERDRYDALARSAAAETADPASAPRAVLSAFLQSPNFLYRVEVGTPAKGNDKLVRFDDFELASRLSFALTDAPPDADLFDAAEQGLLRDPAVLKTHAMRLLSGQRAKQALTAFLFQVTNTTELPGLDQDPELYPEVESDLGQSLRTSSEKFFEEIVAGEVDVMALLQSREAHVDGPLQALYGLPVTLKQGQFERVTLPEDSGRQGFFLQAPFLARHANRDGTNPIVRGKVLREVVLCQPLADPPPGLVVEVKDPTPGAVTMRDRLEHTNAPGCVECHQMMNPLGLALESYDAIGRHRTEDQGQELELAGEVDGQAFNDAREMMTVLSQRSSAGACLVEHLLSHVLGRSLAESEARISTSIADGGDMHIGDILGGIVESNAFRFARL